ncbi:MAG: NAD(P)H-dependent oxidoreductase [Nitrososphaerota archaeon]|nr:NAD(P)H-dependent oxidoreductase [Candidatus Bathyarchaeota archaeon]MDW8048252.1 NAD(P)H-dependent oxidoreductase [Nitrososphaerota archaeon]
MVEVLILYYSRTGKTELLAKAVADGVGKVEGAKAKVKRVEDASIEDFIKCDAVSFGSPNYFGYMSGLMKDFFDRAWNIRDKVAGKPAAAFTSGGGPSNSALLSLERMMDAFRLKKIAEGIVSSGYPTSKDLDSCRKLGEALALAALKSKAG